MANSAFDWRYALYKLIDNPGGVAGLIALLITVTLCIAYIRTPTEQTGDLGKVLMYALATIIGFYSGTATVPSKTLPSPPVSNPAPTQNP